MSAPYRLGLVGAGAISHAYGAAIASGTAAQLTAVSDINRDAALSLAADTGAQVFTSHIDLALSGACDAVIVTTPPITHMPIVIDLTSRGLHVLCEKPLSVDFESAQRMARAAKDAGVTLSMASKFRFTADVIEAQRMIAAGEIGTPIALDNVFTGVVDMTKRWNSDAHVSGGGVLIDNGTHSVDIVRYLLGPITDVVAVAGPRLQPIQVEDSVTMIARTQNGAQATLQTSWSVHKDRASFIEIYGSEGTIEVGWKGSRIRRGRTGAWESFGSGYDKVKSFAGQVEHFTGVLRGEDVPLPTIDDALASVSVIQAAYRSMTSGTWTPVEADRTMTPSLHLSR